VYDCKSARWSAEGCDGRAVVGDRHRVSVTAYSNCAYMAWRGPPRHVLTQFSGSVYSLGFLKGPYVEKKIFFMPFSILFNHVCFMTLFFLLFFVFFSSHGSHL